MQNQKKPETNQEATAEAKEPQGTVENPDTNSSEQEKENREPTLKTDEVIDVEWPQVEQIYKVNEYSNQLDAQLADLCIRYEKTKQNLLKRMADCQSFLFDSGSRLKDGQNIDPTLTYELKLPKQEGDKAFFVRKDT